MIFSQQVTDVKKTHNTHTHTHYTHTHTHTHTHSHTHYTHTHTHTLHTHYTHKHTLHTHTYTHLIYVQSVKGSLVNEPLSVTAVQLTVPASFANTLSSATISRKTSCSVP